MSSEDKRQKSEQPGKGNSRRPGSTGIIGAAGATGEYGFTDHYEGRVSLAFMVNRLVGGSASDV